MSNDYLAIASEIRELEKLLAAIPDSNVIERMSLESRLESARDVWDQICHDAFMSEPDDALNKRHAQTLIDLLTRR